APPPFPTRRASDLDSSSTARSVRENPEYRQRSTGPPRSAPSPDRRPRTTHELAATRPPCPCRVLSCVHPAMSRSYVGPHVQATPNSSLYDRCRGRYASSHAPCRASAVAALRRNTAASQRLDEVPGLYPATVEDATVQT